MISAANRVRSLCCKARLLTATVPDVAARTIRRFQREGVVKRERGIVSIVDQRALHEAAALTGRAERSADLVLHRNAS